MKFDYDWSSGFKVKFGSTRAPDGAYQLSRSSSVSGKEDFLRILPYMGMAAILVV